MGLNEIDPTIKGKNDESKPDFVRGESGMLYPMSDFSPPGSSLSHVEASDGTSETDMPVEFQPE